MLSDQGSDMIMAHIEHLTNIVYFSQFEDIDKAAANAILNHLYDLHELRDIEMYNDLCELASHETISTYTRVWKALKEMNDA